MFETRKVGGIRFIRIGRYTFTFCKRKRRTALDRLVIEGAKARVSRCGKF